MKLLSIVTSVSCVGALLLCACAVTPDGDEEQTGSSEQRFTRTVVVFNEDGTESVKVDLVTEAELQAEVQLREQLIKAGDGVVQQAITQDTGCAGSSIWVNDQTNQNGNRICFYGYGYVNLGNYCRAYWNGHCILTWSGATRSYWSGTDYGRFGDNQVSCCGSCNSFAAWTQVDTASACEQGAAGLALGGYCTPC